MGSVTARTRAGSAVPSALNSAWFQPSTQTAYSHALSSAMPPRRTGSARPRPDPATPSVSVYMSMVCSDRPMGQRHTLLTGPLNCTWKMTSLSVSYTSKDVMSNTPGWNTAFSGYVYVPGP